MFDVRIQKSESNKGNGCGESGNSSNELKEVYPKEFLILYLMIGSIQSIMDLFISRMKQGKCVLE